MIRNISYNRPEIRKEIESLVGKPFPLLQRLNMKGIGSPKYLIKEASEEIMEKLDKDNNLNYCNIELRPAGIIIGFRSLLETYGWILPYSDFRVTPGNGSYSIRSGDSFMQLENNLRFDSANRFMEKLIRLQNEITIYKNSIIK